MTRRLNLSGSCAKLERALFHHDVLGDEMETLWRMGSGKFSLPDEEIHPHPRGFLHLFRTGHLIRPRPEVGLIFGDYIQNVRAALDHLAWELVRGGTHWPPDNPRAVQFPIYSTGRSSVKTKRTFANRVDKEVPGITDEQRALVDSYQPYHRGNWHLAALANLSNQDKHRITTPVHTFATKIERRHLSTTVGSIVAWRLLLPIGRRVNERTPFLEVVADSPDAEVEMHARLSTKVAFQERAGRYHYVPSLREVGIKVAEIVGRFAFNWGRREDVLRCATVTARLQADPREGTVGDDT